MRAFPKLLAIAAALLLGTQAACAARLIYRIDGATATVEKRHLVILAHGAVRSGGWDRPQLRVRESSALETGTLAVEFVARPPAPNEVVVQALLPIDARIVTLAPRYGATRVRIIGETNDVIVPITR